jgi:ABC-type dipeptide/oligopeptide/nickel transport system permease subunit
MSLPMGQMETAGEAVTEDKAVDRDVAGRSPLRIAFDRLRHDKIAVTCSIIVFIFVLIAIFAPLISSLLGVELNNGDTADLDIYLDPAVGPPFNGFTWAHPLGLEPGTADDLTAEWLYGARTSLGVAFAATIFSTLIGVTIGLLAGFSTGWLDRIITFVIDTFLSLPFLLVALAVSPIIVLRFRDNPPWGLELKYAQLIALILVLTFFGWMTLARLIRGEVLSLREREFVQSARCIGMPTKRILFKELLPNLVAPIVVSISLSLPAYVAAEAALAYLGVGAVGIPSWGQTIDAAQNYFRYYPLYLFAPVVGILVLVVALNLLGDAIRDAVDPKTRR